VVCSGPATAQRQRLTTPEASLLKAIGVRQLTAAIINTTVGAGIFVIPALVAQDLGAAAPLAFLICGAMMALIAVTLAMAGSRVTVTGGIYAYVLAAFGPYVALLAGVLQWLSGIVAVSGVSSAFLDQLGTVAPVFAAPAARVGVLAVVLIALAQLNAAGVRLGTRLVEAVTLAKLAPLAVFLAVGAFFVDPAALAWPGFPTGDTLGRVVLLLIFAYSGVEVALAPSGEVARPERTVPRAVLLALGLITILYIAIQVVAQGTLGPELATSTGAPLAAAAGRFLGAFGTTFLLLGAVCSMFGYICGDMLSTPRSWYALARDGFLPSFFMRIDPVTRTPKRAIWAHAVVVLALASTNRFEGLAIIANVALLTLYLLCCAAALQLSRKGVIADAAPFMMRGASIAPVLAAGLVIWILSTATAREFLSTGLVLAAATVAYLVKMRRQSAAGA
jgi:basic amino acid/polyamine antiporter, APA family